MNITFLLLIALLVFLITHLGIYFFYFKKVVKKSTLLLYCQTILAISVTFIVGIFLKTKQTFLKKARGKSSLVFTNGCLIRTEKVKIKIPNLPQTITAIQLSDLHIGTIIKGKAVEKIIQKANALKSDIIFLTGDIIDAQKNIAKALESLSKLNAPLGVYLATGNHEFTTNPLFATEYRPLFHDNIESVLQSFKNAGIRILENENTVIAKEGVGLFNLAGVYDQVGTKAGFAPDLNQALSQRNTRLPTIFLAHQPAFTRNNIKEEHQVDLVLSGHIHGGGGNSLYLHNFFVSYNQPYIQGLYQHNPQTQIYVNRGTHFWGPKAYVERKGFWEQRIPILRRAEITYFELVPSNDKNE